MKCFYKKRTSLKMINLMLVFLINFQLLSATDVYYEAIPNATQVQVGEPNSTSSTPLLHQRFTTSCSKSNGLLISGDHVKFSDFVGSDGRVRNDCKTNLIKVFASHKLIIDRDWTESKSGSRVIIIAPNWQISGFRTISLNLKMLLGISKAIINRSNLIIASNRSEFIDIISLENQSQHLANSLISKNDTSTNFHVNTDKTYMGLYEKQRRKRSVSSNDDETSLLISSFKSFLRVKSQNDFEKPNLLDFHDLLEKHKTVQSFYSTLTLVNDFESLENDFYSLKKHVDFLPFYKSLLNRISEYAKSPKPNENSLEYKTINTFLYTATLSKIYSLTGASEPNLIVDISSYLDLTSKKFDDSHQKEKELQKEIDQLSKDKARANQLRQQIESINKLNKDYKQRFENKISEANEFIKTDITPGIDKINTVVGEQIDKLVEETRQLRTELKKERDKAIERKKEIARKNALRGIFSFLKIFCAIISFLGPIGMAVGATVGAISSTTEAFTIDKPLGPLRSIRPPSSIYADLNGLKNAFLSANELKIANLNHKLNLISKELEKERGNFVGLLGTVSNIRSRLDKLKKESKLDANKEIKALEDELKSSVNNVKRQLSSKRKKRGVRTESTLKILGRVDSIVGLGRTGLDIFEKHRNDRSELDEASRAIQEANAKLKQLGNYQDQIFDSLIPMVKNMESDLHEVASRLKTQSQVALDVKKWQVQSALRDAKLTLRKFTDGFEIEDFLARSIEKLEEAMTTLINVYDRIQNYEEKKEFADFITAISLVGVEKIEIKDYKLKRVYQQLEITISSNLVINEYNVAISALKQWLFPFAHLYLQDFSLPSHLVDKKISSAQHVVSNADKQIKDIVSKIKAYKSATFNHDRYIYSAEFSSTYASSKPFFTWSNENYKLDINDLLNGEEVSLFADVLSSDKDKDAIKFNSLKFLLKSENASKQSDLDFKLKGFKISATHMGNSYLRFKSKVYVLNSVSQSIVYSFETDDKGEPVHQNFVYKKIKSGDLMLSPYAMWKVKLVRLSGQFSFDDLELFKDEVFVELAGRGTYVGTRIKDVNFDEFEKYVQ